MATLPQLAPPDPTLAAIDGHIVARQKNEPKRGYLGMSFIGEECERRQWYGFRFTNENNFDAETLRRFEDGHRGEELMASRLRLVPGVQLYTHGQDGKQFGFQALGGHFRGNIDGAIVGLLQAPKTYHVWEHKVSEKFNQLLKYKNTLGEKAALAKWNPTYYAQAICYMHYSGMERHYLTCDTPGGRATVSVRTDADKAVAERMEAKAERIIFAAEPLPRLSDDPAFYQCKYCPSAGVCHRGEMPQVSCRTCLHATPELDGDGRWSCAKRAIPSLTLAAQQAACSDHLYIPALVTWGALDDASESEGWVQYACADGFKFRNGPRLPGSFSSTELAALSLAALRSEELQAIRNSGLPHAQFVAGSEWTSNEMEAA